MKYPFIECTNINISLAKFINPQIKTLKNELYWLPVDNKQFVRVSMKLTSCGKWKLEERVDMTGNKFYYSFCTDDYSLFVVCPIKDNKFIKYEVVKSVVGSRDKVDIKRRLLSYKPLVASASVWIGIKSVKIIKSIDSKELYRVGFISDFVIPS